MPRGMSPGRGSGSGGRHEDCIGIAKREEATLGDEQVSVVDGCPRDRGGLPRPPAPLTIGIDGCYVWQWEDKKKQCEVTVGQAAKVWPRLPEAPSNPRREADPVPPAYRAYSTERSR